MATTEEDITVKPTRAAPYAPRQGMSTTYVMSADDTSLHFDINALTPKQIEEFESHKDLMGFLQVALIGLGKPDDHVMLYEAFGQKPWHARLKRYEGFFKAMGLSPIPSDHWHFIPRDPFYEAAAERLPETDSVTLYMTSGTNGVLHEDPDFFSVSQNVNSKVHFAEHAPQSGIPVPNTLVTTKKDLGSDEVKRFMRDHDNSVMLKILGLSGARNVTSVSSLDDCYKYLREFGNEMDVILQEKLDLNRYTEMTADLLVTNDAVRISNVRKILFAEGIWVGNLIGPEVILTEKHKKELLKLGEYVRQQGYAAPEGFNCGVDYFISDDDFKVTEINARWTGGLFPAEMIRLVGAEMKNCIAFVDLVCKDKFETYLNFVEMHLYCAKNADFSIIPLGASAIPQTVDGVEHFFAWQIVVGDFESFKIRRAAELGDGALMRADSISVVLQP